MDQLNSAANMILLKTRNMIHRSWKMVGSFRSYPNDSLARTA